MGKLLGFRGGIDDAIPRQKHKTVKNNNTHTHTKRYGIFRVKIDFSVNERNKIH